MVKPQFFTHYELYEAEQRSGLPVRLAFEGLWCVADREGRFEWKPPVLKLDILPYDTVDFAAVLSALEQSGFIRSYEVNGRRFGVIPTFSRHQNPHVRENESVIPPPPASTGLAPGQPSAKHCTGPAESESESESESEEKPVGVAVIPIANGAVETVRGVLSSVADQARRRSEADDKRSLVAEFVFAYWALVMQRPRVLFDDKRRTRIEAALRQNKGDVGELLYAIDGAKRTPYLMGENDRQQKYDGIETIFRDRGQIEKLAGKIPAYSRGEPHPRVAELGVVA